MDQVEKLKAEEERLIASINPNPSPQEEVEAGVDDTSGPAGEPEEIVTAPTPEDPQPKPKQRVNWKKRFTNYKSQTDATIFEARAENAALRSQVAAIEQKMHQMMDQAPQPQGDMFKDVFTEDQKKAFGEDGLDVVTTAAQHAAKVTADPIREQLKVERNRRLELEKQNATKELTSNYNKFLSKLGGLVEDFQDIDADPRFAAFLENQDPGSVYSRKKLFHQAETNLNAVECARHFKDFKISIGQSHRKPEIDRHVAPIGAPGSDPAAVETNNQPRSMSMSWIKQFTDNVGRGKYRENMEEAKRIQSEIDHHLNMGWPLTP